MTRKGNKEDTLWLLSFMVQSPEQSNLDDLILFVRDENSDKDKDLVVSLYLLHSVERGTHAQTVVILKVIFRSHQSR